MKLSNILQRLLLIAAITIMLGSVISAQTVTQAWVARANGAGNDKDQAKDVVADNSGNVYVTGMSMRSTSTWDYDCVTIKYNSSGVQQWKKTYNSSGNGDDIGEAIAVDGSGNVYVTGGSDGDYLTIKYNSAGTQQWLKKYNGTGSSTDYAWDLAVDGSGNVFVTGGSKNASGDKDCVTIKYNSSGTQQWAKRYNFAGNNDQAYAIALWGSSYVYITGYSDGGVTDEDYITIKYQASNGTQLWTARYNGPSGVEDDNAHDIAVTSSSVYVTGESYDPATHWDAVTVKYSAATGAQSWARRYNGAGGTSMDRAFAIALDASENPCVVGYDYGPGTNRDYVTIKYNSSGTQQWANTYDAAGFDDWGKDIAVDASGNVYVTGESETSNGDEDYVTIKYSATGTQKWVATYDGPATGWSPDWGLAIAVDASNNVYVTGQSEGTSSDEDYATVKYTQSASSDCGDADGNGMVNISDAVYLINYIFAGGPPPNPYEAGDVNCDETVNISDVVYLINYIFAGGPEPCAECKKGEEPPLGKVTVGNASLLPDISHEGNGGVLNLTMNANSIVQGVQLRFELVSGTEIVEIMGLVDGLETFYGVRDGYLDVGLIDLMGAHKIDSGINDLLRIRYTGDTEPRLAEAIVVSPEARKLNVNILSAKSQTPTLPSSFSLAQNVPNPFNPVTDISYSLPVASQVRLTVYNAIGQKVATLADEFKPAGNHVVNWRGQTDDGNSVASGIYFYRLEVADFCETRKMLLLK